MSKRHLLVSGLVAALCAGILVLFTEIEASVQQWLGCGPLVALPHPRECRR
jgi:hypothetical protein